MKRSTTSDIPRLPPNLLSPSKSPQDGRRSAKRQTSQRRFARGWATVTSMNGVMQFTPTVDDAIGFAIWQAEQDGTATRTRFYFWVSGFATSGLLGATIVGGVAAAFGLAWRTPALVGLAIGFLGWIVAMRAAPHLRKSWSNWRTAVSARHSYQQRGAVQLWLDTEGLNSLQDGLHTHLNWTAISRILDADEHVVLTTTTGLQQHIPKRIGAAEVEKFRTDITQQLGHGTSPKLDVTTLATLPDRPHPGHRADLTYALTAADVEALSADEQRFQPRTAAERDYRLGTATRSFMVFTVLAIPFAKGLYHQGPPVVFAAMGIGLLVAVLGWFAAGHRYAQRRKGRAARAALHEFAAVNDQRELWLDSDGLGWSDAASARHADWASLSLVQTPDHHFLHTSSLGVGVVIPRRIGKAADAFISAIGPHLDHAHGGSRVADPGHPPT